VEVPVKAQQGAPKAAKIRLNRTKRKHGIDTPMTSV